MSRSVLKHFPLVLVVFVLIDSIWLGLVAPAFYQSQIGFLLRDVPNWYAAGAFYPLYIVGLTVFVVTPAIRAGSFAQGAGQGAFFGLVTYATYDLTNLATIEGWPLLVTVVDLAWGAFLCSATTLTTMWVQRRWKQ